MKWTEKQDQLLIELIKKFKTHKEIALLIGTSHRSVHNRCFRLGVKNEKIHHEDVVCKECEKIFNKPTWEDKVFCSRSCSTTFNNRNRTHTEDTKNKIRNKALLNSSKLPKQIKVKEIKIRFCKHCLCERVYGKKQYCEMCKLKYYDYYRPACSFDFKFESYPGEFDLRLVKQFGFYSPSNKGNNLNGISRDHLYSVREGFLNKVSPEIMKHPANCALMIHKDNNVKNDNSSITLEELKIRIENWNKKYK